MADRTTGLNPYRGFKFAYTLHGGPPAIAQVPLVSDTYYPGQVLRISATTGSAAVAAAAGTAVAYVAASYVSAANSVIGKHPVYLLDASNVFLTQKASTGKQTEFIGDAMDLAVGSTENHYVSTAAATNVFTCVGFPGADADAEATNNNLYVKVRKSIFGDGVGSTTY